MNIVIAGLAKNCENNFKKNIEYLIDFKEFYKESIEISILILENDSEDNTKKIIKKFADKNYITNYCLDGLDKKLTNRIERITYCRNFLLEKLTSFQPKKVEHCLYVSIDFDLDLFSKTPKEEFFKILNKLINQKDLTALFPNNVPYYYDVHALRKDKWNTTDSWKKYNQISKYMPVGKFFLKYFLIYKKQIKINTNQEFINVDSAFGGIGIYKIRKIEPYIKYKSDEFFEKCEHINFNSYFNCAIYTPWEVESPKEHLEYKNLNFLNKLRYIFASFIGDVKNIFLYFKKN